MEITEIVKRACGEVVRKTGYDLVDVTYAKEFGVWELTLLIKRLDGAPVTHADCETVTHAVDDLLEELDPTKGEAYNLSVSSVGVEL